MGNGVGVEVAVAGFVGVDHDGGGKRDGMDVRMWIEA